MYSDYFRSVENRCLHDDYELEGKNKMKTTDLFKKKMVLSFEVFPPKPTTSIQTIYKAIDGLAKLHPDFISVTYSAGGSGTGNETVDIASKIKNDYQIESVAHLPGIQLTREKVKKILADLDEKGNKNILALRGDRNPQIQEQGDFEHADELVRFIKENGNFNVIGACYPEGHGESENLVSDIHYLKQKVDAGVDHLITQLFFDNNYFYQFRERTQIAGINVPIEAGIMPVVNKKQIERMVSLCGVALPDKFLKMMNRYEHQAEAMRDAGIAYAVNQIVDLIIQGVDGIHLYTMNQPYIAEKICGAVASLFRS